MKQNFYDLVRKVIEEVGDLRRRAEQASGGRRAGLPTDLLDTLSADLSELIVQGEYLQQIRDFNQEVIRVQEEERKRIAREIHDGPAQSFASFVRQIEFCEKLLRDSAGDPAMPERVITELEGVKSQMRQGLQELRKFIFELRPPALEHLGLPAAIRQYVQTVCDSNSIKGSVQIDEALPKISMAAQVTIFRIVQEAVNNVIKHAQAGEFAIKFQWGSGILTVKIEDNGVGLGDSSVDQVVLLQGRRLGLVSMQERAELVGGKVYFESNQPKGAVVRLTIPIDTHES